MKFPKSISLKSWVVFCGCILIFIFSYFRLFDNYELISYDLRFRLRPSQKISQDIVIIEISDDTLKNLGKWPLPRDFHASLVGVLKDLGAKMIVFDVLFAEPTVYDDIFSQSINKSGNVYLPLAFYISDEATVNQLFPRSNAILADICQNLKQSAKGTGHINVFVDSDGKIRRIPLFVKFNHMLFPNLGLKAASDWLGLNIKQLVFERSKVIIDNKLSLPIFGNGSFMVNYPAKWKESFKHLSYFEILKSYKDAKRGIRPRLDLSIIKDKACFIGLTATGTSDLKPIPLENIYPMLGLQASLFNSILNMSFISDAGLFINILINIFIFILCLLICLRLPFLKALLGSIIIGFAYFVISTAIFVFYGVWIDLFFPLFIVGITYIFSISYRFFAEARKRQLLEKELDIARTIQNSFLPQEIKEFRGLSISSFIQPAKFVAGDLYDILKIDDKKIGVFIADVSGKGVPASLIMAQTISLFRIFARQYLDCRNVLSRLNKELYERFSGRFVTCLYMIIDTLEQKTQVCSAGHAPLLLYKKNCNEILEVELSSDLPLGISEDVGYKEITFDIAKGDKIIVFTDGLFEVRNRENQELGLKKIKDIILENAHSPCAKLLEAIKDEVSRFSYRAAQHDDITLIVLANT